MRIGLLLLLKGFPLRSRHTELAREWRKERPLYLQDIARPAMAVEEVVVQSRQSFLGADSTLSLTALSWRSILLLLGQLGGAVETATTRP